MFVRCHSVQLCCSELTRFPSTDTINLRFARMLIDLTYSWPINSHPPSEQLFASALQFYRYTSFIMTPSSYPSTSASNQFPRYGPLWQEYDLHQSRNGGSQMFACLSFSGQGALCTGVPYEPTVLLGNYTSHSANIIQLYPCKTSFHYTWETPHYPPNKSILAISRTMENRYPRDCWPVPINGAFLQHI